MNRRHARVTFLSGTTTIRFVGMWGRWDADVFRGERREDDPEVEDGYKLHLAYVDRGSILGVEREDPVYGGWIKAPEGWLDELEVARSE